MPEGPVPVGDALQRHRSDVAPQRHRGVEDAIGRDEILIRERQQLLADLGAVAELEVAHAAHVVRRFAVLDVRFGDGGMPGVVAVEVPQDRPDALHRCVYHRGAGDPEHHRRPK